MRRAVFLVVFIFHVGWAWSQSELLDQTMRFNNKGKTVKTLLREVETHYELSFSYNDKLIEKIELARIDSSMSLRYFLDTYFLPQSVNYKLHGKQLVLFAYERKPSKYILSGFIRDKNTGEELIGANLYFKQIYLGAATNAYGYYSVKIEEGLYEVQVSCLGYKPKKLLLRLSRNQQLMVHLEALAYQVGEVVVRKKVDTSLHASSQINTSKLDIRSLKKFPGLFGENDALRNVSYLPGVQSSESAAGRLFVRGGTSDQTVFMMDDANLYEVDHMGGFFSIFNPDVIKEIQIFKSDVPVNVGSAMSSLVDVRLREGNMKKWQFNGGIGLISARASVEGPLVKDKASMLLAARRTYLDLLLRPIFNSDKETRGLKFYFYDINYKFNYKLNEKNRLYLSGYNGSDVVGMGSLSKKLNMVTTLRWNKIISSDLFRNMLVSFSQNRYVTDSEALKDYFSIESKVNNWKLSSDYTKYLSEGNMLKFGFGVNYYSVFPQDVVVGNQDNVYTDKVSSRDYSLQNSLYAAQDFSLGAGFKLQLGTRLNMLKSVFHGEKRKTFYQLTFEPNLDLKYDFGDNARLQLGYNRQVQAMHKININMIGVSSTRWLPASAEFKPEIANNISLGYFKSWKNGIQISSEAYYRHLENLIDPFQNTRVITSKTPERLLYKAEGKASGVEFMFSLNKKRFNCILSYDFNRTLWSTKQLNDGKSYHPSHERPHAIKFASVIKLTERTSFSLSWQFASGAPFTPATGVYQLHGKTFLQYDQSLVNSRRMPDYHRMDIGLDIASKRNKTRRWKGYWNFSIMNVYGHMNALAVNYFTYDDDSFATKYRPGYVYMYRFVPAVSYRFKF